MPPSVQVLPPASNVTAISLRLRSVVMMASAASALPFAESADTSDGMPASMGLISSGCPITPVEATTTSSSLSPVSRATSAHISSATCTPSALQVLALPLLHTIACAKPLAKCALVTSSGAPLTRFRV